MIDWHSHVLPKVDDGSKNVEESLAMLDMLKSQGIDTVAATSHFYANDESVSSFLERRQKAYEELCKSITEKSPEILLGAEVYYYSGISRMNDLKLLRLQDSKVLLLEMPMSKWSDYTVRELIEISSSRDFKLVIAHLDRYMHFQSDKVIEKLLGNGILVQVNASFFNDFLKKRKALNLLSNGYIHFVGSDCHNTKTRPPRIGGAYDAIRKKFGEQFLSGMDSFGRSVLSK